MTHFIYNFIDSIKPEWAVFLVATLPVSELRGAIPLAILKYKMPWFKTYLIAVSGNMVPVIPWLLFLNYIQKHLMRFRYIALFFNWIFARTRKKGRLVEEYETLGLMFFVSIPLPITGAWTGCIAAFLFGVKFRHALIAIFLGVLISGVIVTTLTELGWIGGIIAGIVLISLAVFSIIEIFKHEG